MLENTLTVTRYINGVRVEREDLKKYTITNEVVLSNLSRIRKKLLENNQKDSNLKN